MKVEVVKWCRKKWNEHNLMYIYHKQYEIKQKIQWNSSNGQLHLFPIDSLCKAMQTQTLKRLVKSIVLENKVVINFDFRSGAKKSGHLDYSFKSYGPKFVNMHKTCGEVLLKKTHGHNFDL